MDENRIIHGSCDRGRRPQRGRSGVSDYKDLYGFINSGTGNMGAFGAAGASLAGDTATFSFTYDTGLLEADVNGVTDGSFVLLDASSEEAYADYAGDGAITKSVTINSQTLTIANSGAGDGRRLHGGGAPQHRRSLSHLSFAAVHTLIPSSKQRRIIQLATIFSARVKSKLLSEVE